MKGFGDFGSPEFPTSQRIRFLDVCRFRAHRPQGFRLDGSRAGEVHLCALA